MISRFKPRSKPGGLFCAGFEPPVGILSFLRLVVTLLNRICHRDDAFAFPYKAKIACKRDMLSNCVALSYMYSLALRYILSVVV